VALSAKLMTVDAIDGDTDKAIAAVAKWFAEANLIYTMQLNLVLEVGTVRVFRQNSILEDAIGSHACSLEASTV
jgi:hypothetical protein